MPTLFVSLNLCISQYDSVTVYHECKEACAERPIILRVYFCSRKSMHGNNTYLFKFEFSAS